MLSLGFQPEGRPPKATLHDPVGVGEDDGGGDFRVGRALADQPQRFVIRNNLLDAFLL